MQYKLKGDKTEASRRIDGRMGNIYGLVAWGKRMLNTEKNREALTKIRVEFLKIFIL